MKALQQCADFKMSGVASVKKKQTPLKARKGHVPNIKTRYCFPCLRYLHGDDRVFEAKSSCSFIGRELFQQKEVTPNAFVMYDEEGDRMFSFLLWRGDQ
jgi:hypothetical protein